MATPGSPSPGWYPDPRDPSIVRWWDGNAWGPQTHPAAPVAPAQQTVESHKPRGLFGGRRELEAEVARLNEELNRLGVPEREALRAEVAQLRAEVPNLRAERDALQNQVVPLRGERESLRAVQASLEALRREAADLAARREALEQEVSRLADVDRQAAVAKAELQHLQTQVVETRDTAILQEVGIYEYHHPLDDSPSYKAKLSGIAQQIKDSAKAGNAVMGSTTWTVNGSQREGARMVREFSKLMLRAYNNEADNAVRTMKPYQLESSVARLVKAREAISKLGATMGIRVTDHYHALRVTELELTADYLAKVAEEKEREREQRERRREEEIAKREYEREQQRLEKEKAHYENTIASLVAEGKAEDAERAAAKVTEIQDAIDGVTRRAANIKAGHVYIISNLGAFGPDVVKIGMTRRLDPMDRVRELGDASVPFRYDVHALIPSDDAVGLETHLHHRLDSCRMNLVNMRREFFRAHPSQVKAILDELGEAVLHWKDEPEALEWRQSENTRLGESYQR